MFLMLHAKQWVNHLIEILAIEQIGQFAFQCSLDFALLHCSGSLSRAPLTELFTQFNDRIYDAVRQRIPHTS